MEHIVGILNPFGQYMPKYQLQVKVTSNEESLKETEAIELVVKMIRIGQEDASRSAEDQEGDESAQIAADLQIDVSAAAYESASSVVLSTAQMTAMRCIHADAIGAYQARDPGVYRMCSGHDWSAHLASIKELETAFPFLEKSGL